MGSIHFVDHRSGDNVGNSLKGIPATKSFRDHIRRPKRKIAPGVNHWFRIVYQPYDRSLYQDRRRFGIGGKSLVKYFGERNAGVIMKKAMRKKTHAKRVRLRGHGIIDIYSK